MSKFKHIIYCIFNSAFLHFYERFYWLKLIKRSSGAITLNWTARVYGKNIKIGRDSIVENGVIIAVSNLNSKIEEINIGKNCEIRSGAQLRSWMGTIVIGDNCSINSNTILYGTGGINIGNNVRIAANSLLVASTHLHDRCDIPIASQGWTGDGITIQDNCWIGGGVCILDGITIGHDSIIAAGTVINRSIPPFSVVAGVPGKIIRNRLHSNHNFNT